MKTRPDTKSVLAGLKDFQRATVDYVFERLYGPEPTRRFLVADEVGLGKTLVARGVIARTIEHLWKAAQRIDVIYICSNADIARQNVQRLGIPGCEVSAQSTRLTLLPLQMHDLSKQRVNFVALTPSTSFDQKSDGGRTEERVLLYWLLHRAWGIHGLRAALYVMQENASKSFEGKVKAFDHSKVNEQLAAAFVAKLEERVAAEKEAGQPDLRSRFEELRHIFCRSDAQPQQGATIRRTKWIGELRRLLAEVCLSALEPNLIILDEFQRFKHLLEQDSEAGELARHLFDSDAGHGARVLLLSATPYRGLSLHHETDDDHYGGFLTLLRFLEDGDAAGCKEILAEYREALPAVHTQEGLSRLCCAKESLQKRLRKVIARTERLATAGQRGGMLQDASAPNSMLHPVDVRAFLGVQNISDVMEQGDVVEYWKSAPYLFNFMDSYALKHAFRAAANERDLIRLVREFPETFLDINRMRKYRPIEPANPRLRNLLADTVDRGMWRLLWIPPAMNYYNLAGPFAAPELIGVTKRLVFSAWHMVPRAVAALTSYEAERRMMRPPKSRRRRTQADWKKQHGLLRFNLAERRLAGLPLMLLVYPCLTFAQKCDPRDLARKKILLAAEASEKLAIQVKGLVAKLGLNLDVRGAPDGRWYWLAPMLLDLKFSPGATTAWWERERLAQLWTGAESEETDDGWSQHVIEAKATLFKVREGKMRLGAVPEDLYDVLAKAASAAPATASLRAYGRLNPENDLGSLYLLDAAGQTGRAFLSLFNHAEVIEMIRNEFRGGPYWLRTLEYAHAGGMQAMLDEYTLLLRESLGVTNEIPTKMVTKIAMEIIGALTLRTASLRVDEIVAPRYARNVEPKSEAMHIRFAMRFGDERNKDETFSAPDASMVGTRKERVRAAFNSPFWPFILVSTSVGQEGLDFHHYCHAITHWNLPSNPVDLEQREGRVHRYKGHAVRKNVAAKHAKEALRQTASDAWKTAFDLARANRSKSDDDIVPYWLFPGEAKIERHVPMLPFSREIEHLDGLRRSLAIYRMVFGQSRQEDLIEYLISHVSEEDRLKVIDGLQMDLRPIPKNGQQVLPLGNATREHL